ncbi:hypothetical protein JHC43_18835 [Marinobacter salarius]|jgi:hypothetical protein|nr:hypothetical protein [Marinobacter salarius]
MSDSTRNWEDFLNPEILKTKLISASIYLAAFEILKELRIPANVTGHSGDRDRFAHGHHTGVGFVL